MHGDRVYESCIQICSIFHCFSKTSGKTILKMVSSAYMTCKQNLPFCWGENEHILYIFRMTFCVSVRGSIPESTAMFLLIETQQAIKNGIQFALEAVALSCFSRHLIKFFSLPQHRVHTQLAS